MTASTCANVFVPSSFQDALDVPLIAAKELRLSEIISALSVALDITQGNPQGHCMRTALIGMRLGEELCLPTTDRSALFYALLLKDLGCSSNAAKMSYLFGADDLELKRSTRLIDWTKPGECLSHCWSHCKPAGSKLEKLLTMMSLVRQGRSGAREIAAIRCERGAEIARLLQLPEATSIAIYELDEHWNGSGNPRGLRGQEITLLGRICCLAQTVEVFFTAYGSQSAFEVASQRRGQWFDPELVDTLLGFRNDIAFWDRLRKQDLVAELSSWEPDDAILLANDECLDRVSEAFAKVVDAKSPWTYQHSTRVAEIAVGVARQFGCSPALERNIRRAALLHDIGKLGVSNMILDKPSKPTPAEFDQIRKHPEYSQRILARVEAFQSLAEVAGAHHERLDGKGYHRGLDASSISWVTRVLTVADICEAMSAKRPYRDAMAWEQILSIMSREAGKGIDHDCLEALARWHDGNALGSRVEAQLSEVERLASAF